MLRKDPNKPVFKSTDPIKINLTFKSPKIRLNLMTAKTVNTSITDEVKAIIIKERTLVVQERIMSYMWTYKYG